ncbi:TadE family protein [Microbacterium sp. NPDC087868]|uniref:TadE family protein n=1 Tax=Microbacterium sp. NPDC087868 TaxID=3364195 RepID=UPI00384ECA3C
MLRWRAWGRNDDGSAALEFITVGVILLVPFAYLVIVLGAIQEQSLGAEAAARHIARTIALSTGPESAALAADDVLTAVVEEYRMDAEATDVALSCVPEGAECPTGGATLRVTVTTVVRMPFVPEMLGLDSALAVPLEATSVQKVGRGWGSG